MALELKKLTLDGGLLLAEKAAKPAKKDSDDSEESSEVDEALEKAATERAMRHINDIEWTKFCKGHLKVFETKWTKKLEEYDSGAAAESSSETSEEPVEDHIEDAPEPPF